MNARERRVVDIKMKWAYMKGYERGFNDAVPMQNFVRDLMELMDPRVNKAVDAWAKKMEKENRERAAEARKRLAAETGRARKLATGRTTG